MRGITVISFDIGNTLLRLGSGGFCVEFGAKTGMSKDALRPLMYEHFLTKQRSLRDAVYDLCSVIGFRDPQRIVDDFQPVPVVLFEDAIPALEKLRADGFTMVGMSNCTPWEAGGMGAFGLDRYLQAIFYSFAIGAAKPDPAMFLHVQQAVGEPPERIIHVGDSYIADVRGAKAVGWRAVLLDRDGKWSEPRDRGGDFPVIRSLGDLRRLL